MSTIKLLSLLTCLAISSCDQDTSSLCTVSPDVTYHGLYVDCHDKGLTEIPRDFPTNTTSIDLSHNQIDAVTNYSLSTVNNLRFLNIEHNVITRIESLAFLNCKELRTLKLMQNNVCYGTDMFYRLTSLLLLTIDGCFTERTFINVQGLERMEINANREMSFNGLHHLSQLRYIGIGGIVDLHNQTFLRLKNIKLETVCITSKVVDLEPDIFAPLGYLKELSMINTNRGLRKTLASLNGLVGRNMTALQISRVSLHGSHHTVNDIDERVLHKDSIRYLKDICVERLTLSGNGILFIDLVTIEKSLLGRCLTHLDLSRNILHDLPMDTVLFLPLLSNLRYVDVSEQAKIPSLFNVYTQCFGNKSKGNEKREITETPKVNGFIMYLPPLLEYFNMSGFSMHVGHWKNPRFSNASNLLTLDISYNRIGKVANRILGVDNLRYLDLSGNTDLHLADTFFDDLPSLETLKLNSGSLLQNVLNLHVKRFLKPLPKLISFSISNNRLVELPQDMFASNPLLKHLDLSQNIFISIPIDLLLTPHLHVLDMTSNALGSLHSQSRSKLDEHYQLTNQNFKLHLKDNFFSCSCGNFHFLFWLQETKLFKMQNKNFSCLTQSGHITNTGVINHNALQLWRRCTGEISIFVSGLLLTMMFCSFFVALSIATNYTKLANLLINILGYQIPKPKREDFSRNVYVSYADADYQWVCHELCPALEERELTLYIWDRDSVPGDSIPDQIAENIPQCWKTIVYFTNNYETDPWSYMSMMAAINCVDNLNPERLLLLLPEGEHLQIPHCLLEVVPESCIFHVSVGGRGNDQIWDEIRRMIRTDP